MNGLQTRGVSGFYSQRSTSDVFLSMRGLHVIPHPWGRLNIKLCQQREGPPAFLSIRLFSDINHPVYEDAELMVGKNGLPLFSCAWACCKLRLGKPSLLKQGRVADDTVPSSRGQTDFENRLISTAAIVQFAKVSPNASISIISRVPSAPFRRIFCPD
jgi:hypothetical protein